ncbi:MAG: flagellar hook-basal body complex protein [Oscillibacter sp.]|nr:flagellar hook-basal body complex protein [Oscillibacter sp.]
MTGAMYAAIGGLKTHMSNLNVIGNNIANVNTTAYKAQRMIFQESLYVTSRAGSDGTATRGGNTPSQVGYGVKMGSIDLSMSPGTYNPTGNALDCMIDGDGFFMVGTKDLVMDSGDALNRANFTRAGTFRVDARGYVVDNQNNVVYGFQMVYNPNYIKGADEATILENKQNGINVEDKLILSTTLVPLRVPLAAVEPTEANGGIDPETQEHRWEAGDPVYDVLGGHGTGTTERKNLSLANPAFYNTEDGSFADGIPGGANSVDGEEEFNAENFITVNGGAIPNLNDTVAGLEGLSVNENGAIIGTAGNGDTVIVGYIAIAQVTAPDGVTHIGGPYYKAQEGSGAVSVGIPGGLLEAGVYLNNATADEEMNYTPELQNLLSQMKSVKIQGSGLEASTADVATEFANMIVTQRGYQANTRIVTVTDSMLEELVNMKR